MKTLSKILILLFISSLLHVAQTTQNYFQTFSNNSELGWTFLSSEGTASIQNDELIFTSQSDEFVYILPPIGATTGDFSIKVKNGSLISGLEGGGFGRAGFKSSIAILYSEPLYGDSIIVVYSNNPQSFDEPNFIKLSSYPSPDDLNSLQLDVVKDGTNLNIKAYINDQAFYEGQLLDADPGVFTGNMIFLVDPVDGEGLKEWSLDEVEISYNPLYEVANDFYDDFNEPNSPWFKFGDFDNVYRSVNILDGKLKFNYNQNDETALYVIAPIGCAADFTIEFEGVGSENHNSSFSISRFYDYRNYITAFIEEETIYIGYADNSFEPVIVGSSAIVQAQSYKLKVSVETEGSVMTLKAWVNDNLLVTGNISNPPEKLKSGCIAFGFDRGNVVEIDIDYVSINYEGFPGNDPTYVNEDINSPTEFGLSQNYPNPFNPATTIEYTIPSSDVRIQNSEHVTLRVYDILGNEVVTLVDEKQVAGIYNITFYAGNLSSGIYLYKLDAGNYSSIKKLSLIK